MKQSIYVHNQNARYLLGETEGSRLVIVCGINPSVATDTQDDPTLMKVRQFAKTFGYDGFVMINVYAERATDPNTLPAKADLAIHERNKQEIRQLLERFPQADLILAFGDLISRRPYLRGLLRDLMRDTGLAGRPVFSIGALTQKGNPRHPLYLSYQTPLQPMGAVSYLK